LDPVTIALTAIALAMDSFSVSVCGGSLLSADCPRRRVAGHTGLVMGGFQAAMPLAGWLGAGLLSQRLAAFDHWIAFGLLAFIGGRMVYEALHPNCDPSINLGRWSTLAVLGVATSIDALAVGVTYAFVGYAILLPVAVIGLVAFGFSYLGVLLGARVGSLLRDRAPLLGGVLLIALGTRILVQHLAAAAV